MPTDFQRLTRDEQKIARLIAARLWVSVADAAAAIAETERCTKMFGVRGLPLQVCESYHEIMRTSQEEAERILKENLLHCAAEAALGGHDLGEWQQTGGARVCGLRGQVQAVQEDDLGQPAGGVQRVGRCLSGGRGIGGRSGHSLEASAISPLRTALSGHRDHLIAPSASGSMPAGHIVSSS